MDTAISDVFSLSRGVSDGVTVPAQDF